MPFRTNRRRANDWLKQIRANLSDERASEIIVPTDEGSVHIRVSGEEVDRFLAKQKKHLKWQARFYQSMVVALVCGLGVVILDVFHREIEEIVASDQYASIEAERDSMERALALYTEFTRDIVAEHHGELSTRLGELGTNTPTVVRAGAATTGTGGLASRTEGVGQVLGQHVDSRTAKNLHEIARIEEFFNRLPGADPLKGSHLTSGFGMREHPLTGHVVPHRGIDLVSWEQPTVLAAGAGEVTFAGEQGKSGKMVTLNHGSAIESLYLHLDSIAVEKGQYVEAGDALGVMGDTGETDGAHLHYEVRVAGRHLDPKDVFEVISRVD